MCIRDSPLSKSTKAFARRETRQGEDPSRASTVSALRSSSLRKPDCIMRATESARSENARNFYRLFNESGYRKLSLAGGSERLALRIIKIERPKSLPSIGLDLRRPEVLASIAVEG